jgi:hypothetical protein
MIAIQIGNRTGSSGSRRSKPAYWSGFSVCMFVMLLAVFTWAVHRRLTQYESLHQAGGHHMTATKVCLTERPQVSVPTEQSAHHSAMLLVVFTFAFALMHYGDPGQPFVMSEDFQRSGRRRVRASLTRFFFLPPPAPLPYL